MVETSPDEITEIEPRYVQRLLVLHEVRNQLLHATAADDLCRMAVELGRTQLGFERLSLWFLETPPLLVRGTFGIDEHGCLRDERDARIMVNAASAMGQILTGVSELVIEQEGQLFDHHSEKIGVGAHILTVISDGETIYGSLSSDTFLSKRPVSAFDCQLLELYASIIGHLYVNLLTQARLRASEERYRGLFSSMAEGFSLHEMLYDAQGHPNDYRFLDVNPAFEVMTGLTRDAVIGRTVSEVLPGIEPFWIERYAHVVQTGESILFEHFTEPLQRFYEVRAFRPAPGQFATVFFDITERHKTAQALLDSESRFAEFIANVPAGIFIADDDQHILYVNDYMKAWLPDASTGELTYAAIFSPEMAAQFVLDDRKTLRDGLSHWEREFTRADGTKAYADVHKFLIRRKDQTPLIGGIAFDITSLREMEFEQEHLQEQLRQMAKIEAIGRLTGGIAHDFNNLLSPILGYADLALLTTALPESIRNYLEQIRTAAQRSATLTRQLLAFSRKQLLEMRVVDVADVVAEFSHLIRNLLGEDIDFQLDCAPDLWPIHADASQLHQVLMNLTINARDAMPTGGTLTIKTRNRVITEAFALTHPYITPGDYVEIQVQDTGIGMDAETQTRIFEPFFTTKAVGKGTGLGLPMVYGIVKQHAGSIEVLSSEGRGVSVFLWFPRCHQRIDEEPQAPPSFTPGQATLLLAEDETMVRELTMEILTQQGYEVLAAGTGPETLALATTYPGPIALLVTDVMMPQMSGRELYERLVETRPELRVLYISGYSEDIIANKGVLLPGTHFLPKPFTAQTLLQKIKEMLPDN